jgi:hypothetical protein
MRKLCVTFLAIAFVLAATGITFAVPPSESQKPPQETKQLEPPRFLRPMEGETSITGVVRDQNQNPLKDVSIKLFIDGVVVASTLTDGAGAYSMKYLIDVGKDKTVMLWYVAPPVQERVVDTGKVGEKTNKVTMPEGTSSKWVPKAVVLHESKAAIASKLISPCIPRVQVKPFLEFDVQMVDVPTRNKQIAQSGCL